MKEMWNKRYNEKTYAYGKEPNVFLKEQLDKLSVGKLLLPAEGEGRNALYATQQKWNVKAIDFSESAKEKTLKLFKAHELSLDYEVGDLLEIELPKNEYDTIALIYAHFPTLIQTDIYRKLIASLKTGGTIILEGFSKKHLLYQEQNPNVGGPKNEDMLFSKEKINQQFTGFAIQKLEEKEVELAEGLYHQGLASVIRFVGVKI